MILKKKGKEIDRSMTLQRDPEQKFNYIDGEVIMLNLQSGEYINFNPVGTRIWELLENPLSFKDLIDALLKEYDIDQDSCFAATKEFIHRMSEKGLLLHN